MTHAHIRTVQWCSSNAFSSCMYKQIPFYRGDRDRSQGQARWEMRHNVQQFCVFFFLDFLIFTCTKASRGKCLNIAFMLYYTWFLIQLEMWINQNRSRELSVSKFIRLCWIFALKHLKTWEHQWENEFICWKPLLSLLESQFKKLDCETVSSPVSRNHITLLWREPDYKKAAAKEIFFF